MINLRYYKNKKLFLKLFTSHKTPNLPESDLFNLENIDPLDENEKILCEGMISEEESLTALKEFKNNKTPGTEGFSAEFYKFFWSDLGTEMTASFSYLSEKVPYLSAKTAELHVFHSSPKRTKTKLYLKTCDPYLY